MSSSLSQLRGLRHELESRWSELSPLDPRSSVLEIQRIAKRDVGIDLAHNIGTVGLSGVACAHHWVEYAGRVIDLSFPVRNPDFPKIATDYVMEFITMTDLKERAQELPMHDYIWPGEDLPDGVKYWGDQVFYERSNTTNWTRYNRL